MDVYVCLLGIKHFCQGINTVTYASIRVGPLHQAKILALLIYSKAF